MGKLCNLQGEGLGLKSGQLSSIVPTHNRHYPALSCRPGDGGG